MQDTTDRILEQAKFIRNHQLPSGAIPWYEDGVADPWDHVECAIALDLAGMTDDAVRAYRWLKNVQNLDGSWYSSYVNGRAENLARDSNYSSYLATGLLYHYLFTGELELLREMWPTVERGLDFVLSLQRSTGEVFWCYGVSGRPWPGALIAGSSCIWQCLRSGVKIAQLLGVEKPAWEDGSQRLLKAIRERPDLFDKLGEDDQRFATSWFYPVLTGAIEGEEAKSRILGGWDEFVVEEWGCKCVSTAPWVTVAETTELIMALCAIGEMDRAEMLTEWIFRLRDPLGGFKTGIKLPEEMIWPEEKNTWTSAGVILALSAQARSQERRVG